MENRKIAIKNKKPYPGKTFYRHSGITLVLIPMKE